MSYPLQLDGVTYAYEAFNHQYGPWYRLIAIKKALRVDNPGWEVLVQPDMDKRRWYWSVRKGAKKKDPIVKWGTADSSEEAREVALNTFRSLL